MNRRTITILGLLQTGALVFGIFFTALFRRIGSGFAVTPGPGVPQPAVLIMAGQFTHYGALLALLIIGWVVWASRSSSLGFRSRVPASLVFISGILLLFALAVLGIFFSLAGTTPMVAL
jgi:hypothetical protein